MRKDDLILPVYKTDAIVIRARDYGEADKILTLFSREYGKIQAIAKGVRKPKSRLRGGVQFLSYSDFLLHKGRSMDTVSQVEQKESFRWLLEDLETLSYAAYLAELVDAAILENEEGQGIFLLTLTCFHLMQSVDAKLVIRCFELRLLNQLGYRPQTKTCVSCHSPVQGEKHRFSVELGGVLCPQCRYQDTYSIQVSGSTLAVMDYLLKLDIRKLDRLKIPNLVNNELEYVIKKFISSKLEKRFKSLDFLSKL
jgi:DNA repair protein RecO (recombination protein O)